MTDSTIARNAQDQVVAASPLFSPVNLAENRSSLVGTFGNPRSQLA